MSVRMKRDERLAVAEAEGRLPAGVIPTRDFMAQRSSQDAELALQTILSGNPNSFEWLREDTITIATRETFTEVREIAQDFLELANACQSAD